MPVMFASVAFDLRENYVFLASTNRGYRKIFKKVMQKALNEHGVHEIRSTIGQADRKVHASRRKYGTPLSLR